MGRKPRPHKSFDHTATPCITGKLTFALEAEADEAAASVTRRNLLRLREDGRTAARSYMCDVCNHWHVTSQAFSATGATAQAVAS